MKKLKDNKKIEKVFASNEVMAMLEGMSDGIQVIAEQHGELVNRFDKMDARFDKMDDRLDKLQDDVTEIKYKLSEKVDMKDFKKLEKRLIKLEKVVLA